MKPGIRLVVFSILIVVTLFVAPAVSAHPLGNFTINHFDGIHVAARGVSLDYVLDIAEIPAFQEISLMDKGPDGLPAAAARTAYADRQCAAVGRQLDLQLNGIQVPLTLAGSGVTSPPGAAGLSTLRLACTFQNTGLQVAPSDRLDFADNSYPDRIGWREIVVYADGVQLQGDFATSSVSQELTSYPQDMLSSPLDVRTVSLKVGPAGDLPQNGPAAKQAVQNTATWSAGARSDPFTQLITLQDTTPLSILIALLIAFVWGGLHSLTPGHGKTIVGAYLVGNRGTALHAVYLGLMTTITHTAGVFLLGLVTLFASRYVLPEQIFPWISILSGVLVVAIGVGLFISRLRTTRVWAALVQRIRKPLTLAVTLPQKSGAAIQFSSLTVSNSAPATAHAAILTVPHTHANETVHTYADGLVHTHADETVHAHEDGSIHAHRDGLIHTHADGTVHTHEDGSIHTHIDGLLHTHSEGTIHTHEDLHHHRDGSLHIHEHGFGQHTHDPHAAGGHSHLLPGADGSKVTLRSLLALGISGGLLPCPSALVVMLGAIALNRIGFGVILVLAFSLGLACVLTGIGLMMVYARRFFDRLPVHSRFAELIPAGSALFITVLGLGITFQALVQMGWIVI